MMHRNTLLCLLSLLHCCSATYTPGFLQSGPDLAGSSFPAHVLYDETTDTVVITGSTFGRFFTGATTVSSVPRNSSSCFLATVSLPTETAPEMKWKSLQTIGATTVNEACSAALFHEKHSKFIVLGHSDRGGILEPLYDRSLDLQATQYGMLLDFDPDGGTADNHFDVKGGRVLQRSRITYPMAMDTTVADGWIYVASQETDSVSRNGVDAENNADADTSVINVSDEVDPMRFFKYGPNYHMTIARYKLKDYVATGGDLLKETLAEGWYKPFATATANTAVHVAGIAEIGTNIVVVGTTDGQGPHIGGDDVVIQPGSMDGFISKFNKDDGSTVVVAGTQAKASRRIQSSDGSDDWIGGMCHDPTNAEFIYVVGATAGKLDAPAPSTPPEDNVEAFIMKVKLDTLEIVWTEQFGAKVATQSAQVRGISCAVTPDGKALWFGGVVQNDAFLPDSGTVQSFGGDDIFIMKLDAEQGTRRFTRQFGSKEDDGFAMRGGITVDKLGNCIVVGSTYGSLYRERQQKELEDSDWISDVFVTTISLDEGLMKVPQEYPELGNAPVDQNSNSATLGTTSTNIAPTTHSPATSSMGSTSTVAIFIVVFCSLVAVAFLIKRSRSGINRDVITDRSKVIEYMNEFDVDDIDLKHSATGGWHCSYSNDLANGRNRRAERRSSYKGLDPHTLTGHDLLLGESLSKTSLLRDSLFMDEEDASELGGGLGSKERFKESRSLHPQGYDGLIDAYNSTWRRTTVNRILAAHGGRKFSKR